MSKTAITVEGLTDEVELNTRFTTVVKHVDRSEAANQRVELRGPNGRVAVDPKKILLIREVLAEGETVPEDEEPAEQPAEGDPSPFAAQPA